MSKTSIKDISLETIQIIIAIVLTSIGLKAFLLPNGFLDGGTTGIAILLNEIIPVDISIILPVVSIPFFILGYFIVDKKIILKSIIALLLLSVFLHFDNFTPITDDKLITSTFGGLFLGVGIGLAIRNGTVLDGSEVLGLYVNDKYGISIGNTSLIFNVILFALTAMVLSPEKAMYSILAYLVTAKSIDFTLQGFENYIGFMIVSSKSEVLQTTLFEQIGQGITTYQGVRGYGKQGIQEPKEIIHLVINRIDSRRVSQLINEIDPQAFIIEFDVNNVTGGKVKRFLTTKKS